MITVESSETFELDLADTLFGPKLQQFATHVESTGADKSGNPISSQGDNIRGNISRRRETGCEVSRGWSDAGAFEILIKSCATTNIKLTDQLYCRFDLAFPRAPVAESECNIHLYVCIDASRELEILYLPSFVVLFSGRRSYDVEELSSRDSSHP